MQDLSTESVCHKTDPFFYLDIYISVSILDSKRLGKLLYHT